ncbi:MAG: hypothetical protein M1823_006667, partial [Watsoniomyces obsoletus]
RAELKGEVLFLSGSRLGQRRPLNPEVLKAVRGGCIDPALKAGVPRPLKPGQNKGLEPVKTFTVSPSAVQGKPFFEAKARPRGLGSSPPKHQLDRSPKPIVTAGSQLHLWTFS